jgi:hypothetical protein
MGIYGSFKYGYIFNKKDLTEDELFSLLDMNESFSIGDFNDLLTISDKQICIDNCGLGIAMYTTNQKTLIVESLNSSHKSEDGFIMKEYKTQKYYYHDDNYDNMDKCSNNNCYYCCDHKSLNNNSLSLSTSPTSPSTNTNVENVDFVSRGISAKPTHYGWFNVVFYSGDLTSTIYLPIYLSLKA